MGIDLLNTLPLHIIRDLKFYSLEPPLPDHVRSDLVHYSSYVSRILNSFGEEKLHLIHEVITEALNDGFPLYFYISEYLINITKRHPYVKGYGRKTVGSPLFNTFFEDLQIFSGSVEKKENIRFQRVFSSLFTSSSASPIQCKTKIKLIISLLSVAEREALLLKLKR